MMALSLCQSKPLKSFTYCTEKRETSSRTLCTTRRAGPDDKEVPTHPPAYHPLDHAAIKAARKPFQPIVEPGSAKVGLDPVYTESFDYLDVGSQDPPDQVQPFRSTDEEEAPVSIQATHLACKLAEAFGHVELAERSVPEPAQTVIVRASFERAKKSIKAAQVLESQQPHQFVSNSVGLADPRHRGPHKVPGTPEHVDLFDDTGSLERGV